MKKDLWCYDFEKEVRIVSRYRSSIMAIAIICIALFHSGIEIENSKIVQFLIKVGYGGVDIFFFLSGIGVWYSLEKDRSISSFYKRRAQRVLPAYIPFIILWFWIVRYDTVNAEGISTYIQRIQEFFGNITMVGWINGLENQFNWYIQALVLLDSTYFLFCC